MTNSCLKTGLTAMTLMASGHMHCSAWISTSVKSAVASTLLQNHRRLNVFSWSPISSRVFYTNNAADDMDDAAMPLSTDDVLLMQSLRRRQVKLPIMMLDTLLPQQVVTVRSSDLTFSQLLNFAMSNCDGRVAVIGMHPISGNALSYGVVAKVDVLSQMDRNGKSDSTTVRLTALHRIHVCGQVSAQQQHEFSVAECEILNDDTERSQGDFDMKAPQLAARLTKLIEQWIDSAAAIGATVREFSPGFSLSKEVTSKDWSLLAFYTAAILQPIPATVTAANIDIRPAMITAQTAYERLLLAVTALQIHLDGHAAD
jgi:hypothetical protein